MASLKLHYFCFLVLFVASNMIFLDPTLCFGNEYDDDDTCLLRKNHAALFVFGDSLFDVGNNNYINASTVFQSNYPPYGETFFNYPSGRFSDGRLIPDFIAEYAKLPLIQPYLFPGNNQRYSDGINFASAGAGALVETHQGLVIDLTTQLSYFQNVSNILKQKLGETKAKTLVAKSVNLINIGSNDYFVLLQNSASAPSLEEYVGMVVGNISSLIKGIHEVGGRKVGILNQPPFGCIVSVKTILNGTNGSCLEQPSSLAKLHNDLLSKELQNLETQLKGFKYSYFDFYDWAFDIINHPSKYGFKESDVACCGSGPNNGNNTCGGKRASKDYDLCWNPSDYVFFDTIHPTEGFNKLFSQIMWSGNQTFTGPYNLETLFQV